MPKSVPGTRLKSKRAKVGNRGNGPTQQQAAYARLREGLVAGDYAPGQPIPVRLVVESLKMGTMPVREALQRLIAEKALEFSPNRTLRVPHLSWNDFTELLGVVTDLEKVVLARAVVNIKLDDIVGLRKLIDRYRTAAASNNAHSALRANSEFWFGVYELAQSPVLLDLIRGLWIRLAPLLVERFRKSDGVTNAARVPFDLERQCKLYEQLVKAINEPDMQGANTLIDQIAEMELKWYRKNVSFSHSHPEHRSPGRAPRDSKLRLRR